MLAICPYLCCDICNAQHCHSNHGDGYFTANRSAFPSSQRKRKDRISEPLNGYRPVAGVFA